MSNRCFWLLILLPVVATAKYFGFYEVLLSDVRSFNNTTNLYQASTVADALRVHAYNQQSLLLVFDIFFASGKLRDDWEARWANLSTVLNKADVVGLNKPILGFNLGDELVWSCYTSDDVNIASEAVRRSYPFGKAIIWYNEAAILQHNPVKDSCGNSKIFYIPKSLDWFSVDIYHMGGMVEGWVHTFVQHYYTSIIFPRLLAHQQVMLVPGSFGSNVNHYPNGTYICDKHCYDVMCAHDAADFADWAITEDRVAAVMPWNWNGCKTCNGSRFTPPHTCCMDEIGTNQMPITKRAWVSAGLKIMHGHSVDTPGGL